MNVIQHMIFCCILLAGTSTLIFGQTVGSSREETIDYLKKNIASYAIMDLGYDNVIAAARKTYNFDISSNILSFYEEFMFIRSKEGDLRESIQVYTFSLLDISTIIREKGPPGPPGHIKITFKCVRSKKCISSDREKYTHDEYGLTFPYFREGEASKVLQAFKHLFSLSGWQEKKALF